MTSDNTRQPGSWIPPRPLQGPDSWHLREVLAYVLVELTENSTDIVKIPRRMLQRDWGRVDGPRVSRALKELVDDEWLLRQSPIEPGRAYLYSYGPRLLDDKRLLDSWIDFSMFLYGSSGLLGHLRFRSSRCFGFLNTSGLLVLAAVLKQPKMRTKEIVEYLAPVMSRKTVLVYLKRLQEIGLVNKIEKQFEAIPEWESVLENYELASRASRRKDTIRHKTYGETIAFQGHFHPDRKTPSSDQCWWRWAGQPRPKKESTQLLQGGNET